MFGGTAPLIATTLLSLEQGLIFLSIYMALWAMLGYFSVNKLQKLQMKNLNVELGDEHYEYKTKLA